ncbi:hypothetical protein CPB85DRAFT_1266398 [Mucidula mucida]|nr:hypothetical protein CPB85DRAFT_1266398 [Mucidula mucida]
MSSPIPLDEAQANWRVDDSLALHTADESNGLNDHAGPGTDLDYKRGGSTEGPPPSSGMKGDGVFREKQVKPNKVYIGGLPENTRQEDLQNCFGKIGNIVNIELKIGYGFVEFDSREAAEESVAKYNEGYFMGNKIRVEMSHGGGRTAKYSSEPGACFRCGQMGHWASSRECPIAGPPPPRREPPLIDRIQRDHPPASRDVRYDYAPMGRDYRRPPSPARDFRDYGPPPSRYDDYRRPPPMAERDRYPPPDRARYDYRSGPIPPAYPPYERYDRKAERYPPYGPPSAGRPRTPPRYREDYDRPVVRDYPDYRGRPVTPPRYPEYPRGASPDARFRRRSESPTGRSAAAYEYAPPESNYPATPPGPPPPSRRDYPPRGYADRR